MVWETPLLEPDKVMPLPPARISLPPTVTVSPAVLPMFDRPAENCVPVWLNAEMEIVSYTPFVEPESVTLLPPANTTRPATVPVSPLVFPPEIPAENCVPV